MTCQSNKDLMMIYLDGEMDKSQKKRFEEHLKSCSECQRELDEFNKLKDLTDSISLAEPEDLIWDQYWNSVYNRVERKIGCVLCSIAGILLAVYGGFLVIENIIINPGIAMFFKVCLIVLIAGLAILVVSVLRERIYCWNRDRYRNVRR